MLKLFDNIDNFVSDLYKSKNDDNLFYHNYLHTIKRLKKANKLIEAEKFNTSEASMIQLALAFSNIGFLSDYKNPFKSSADLALKYFESKEVDKTFQQNVINCIKVFETKQTKNKIEEAVLDIYNSEYGEKKFIKYSSLLKQEKERKEDLVLENDEWLKQQITELSSHMYYTNYAIENWQPRKSKNLAELLNEQKKTQKRHEKERLKAFYKEKYKSESPERGIQTLYRVALRNHIKLSDIADTKANILLSVNAIIISLVLANLLSKLDSPSNRYLILPTIIFVIFSIISMIMSIKATQPNVTRGEFTDKDLKNKNVNLAFFGNFHKMELSRYQSAITNLIKNKDDVYNTLTTDLYYLGSVLNAKYRLLRMTYYIFMIGIIVSVLAFSIAFIYRNTITM
tara:strand:+ start:1945 stop:3138 length:1194 start_codon:yes stop_codon:yes gene_type:complete